MLAAVCSPARIMDEKTCHSLCGEALLLSFLFVSTFLIEKFYLYAENKIKIPLYDSDLTKEVIHYQFSADKAFLEEIK